MKLPIQRNTILQQNARTLRQNQTLTEQRLWQYLRGRQLNGIKFRRQYVIGQYIVDFISLEHRLIIELDGGQHIEQQTYDQQRTAFFISLNYRVIRFWNNDVWQQIDAVLQTILTACLNNQC